MYVSVRKHEKEYPLSAVRVLTDAAGRRRCVDARVLDAAPKGVGKVDGLSGRTSGVVTKARAIASTRESRVSGNHPMIFAVPLFSSRNRFTFRKWFVHTPTRSSPSSFAREPPLNLVYPPFPLAPDAARLRTHVLLRGSFATVFHLERYSIILDLFLLRYEYVHALWNDAKKKKNRNTIVLKLLIN